MIVFPATVLAEMVAAAERAYPREACGLLVGIRAGRERITVSRIVESRNIAERPHERFEIDPQVRFDLMRGLAATDQHIVGHFHSHPDHPAVPSAHDRDSAFEPDLVWVITAVAAGRAGRTAAFRADDAAGGFVPVEVVTLPAS